MCYNAIILPSLVAYRENETDCGCDLLDQAVKFARGQGVEGISLKHLADGL